jgi:hypothetical protein
MGVAVAAEMAVIPPFPRTITRSGAFKFQADLLLFRQHLKSLLLCDDPSFIYCHSCI